MPASFADDGVGETEKAREEKRRGKVTNCRPWGRGLGKDSTAGHAVVQGSP